MVVPISEKVEIIKEPSPEKSNDYIKDALSKDRLIEVFGECKIDYDGRASSYLGIGDRVVILKPDGTLLVHTKNKREPVNWQPPGSRAKPKIIDEKNQLTLISKRRKPREELKIYFEKIYSISSYEIEDNKEIELNRSEKDMGDYLIKKPWVIENGFRIIEREKETDLGYLDLFGEDKEGNKVIIELKRKKIGLSSVSQLKRYHDSLKSRYSELRSIIMGPSLSEKAKNFLEKNSLEFIELRPEACELGTDLKEFT